MSFSEWTEHSRFSRQGAANHSPGSLRYPNKACEALTSTARGLPCSSLPDRLWTSSADTAVTAPLCRSVGGNSPPHSKQAGRGCPVKPGFTLPWHPINLLAQNAGFSTAELKSCLWSDCSACSALYIHVARQQILISKSKSWQDGSPRSHFPWPRWIPTHFCYAS